MYSNIEVMKIMNSLIEFKNFVDEINEENGRLYKESILKKYKDYDSIKYYLNYVYNPYIITGISDRKLNKIICSNVEPSFIPNGINVCEVLDFIKEHNTGRDCDILTVQRFMKSLVSSKLISLFESIITKNLTIGVDVKTINRIMPNLIPEFNVQLANKYFEDPSRIEGHEFALTTKIDGGRIIAIKENGVVTFYTRQGQIYEGLVDLEKEMSEFMPDGICLDGEITLLDPGDLTSKDQYKQTMKITRAKGEKHGVKMLVFDYMPATVFRQQKSLPYFSYNMRRYNLEHIFNDHNYKYFNLLPILYCGTDISEITKWLNYNIEHGEEGVMINLTDAPYEFKRTWSLQKVKKMNDLDLEVIGFEEGTGRNQGRLGALIVEYKGNTVKVGSGYSDELREAIWWHKDEWLGRTIVVQYFEETQNAEGGISLRFPVYVDYRTDK